MRRKGEQGGLCVRKRNQLYTKKDFHISLALAIFFTVVYAVTDSLNLLVKFLDADILQIKFMADMVQTVLVVAIFSWYLLPIILIFVWYMCIERFLYLELRSGQPDYAKSRWRIYVSLVPVIVLGLVVFGYMRGVVHYAADYWQFVEELYRCIAIRLAILFGWLLCLIYSIKKRSAIAMRGGVKKRWVIVAVFLVMALVYLSYSGYKYTYDYAEDLWFKWMIENHKPYEPGY